MAVALFCRFIVYVPPNVCGGSLFGLCFVMHYLVSFLVLQLSWRGRKAGCFALVVFLVSCGCWCSVALSQGVVGWSAVCHTYLLFLVVYDE